ncbi:MAG TPA: hypothetical protein VHL31_06045 [Geminicoccus sp.]|uniref:hypothetical protein n=1 Tax=Geminicoccus sp. TaxID=2024832 RepID=UPI002E380CA4|nr:hypothetical protein [Geminicoccus sp.]HEX2525851.1 hypothetical protein [Geminicoccus sp.]
MALALPTGEAVSASAELPEINTEVGKRRRERLARLLAPVLWKLGMQMGEDCAIHALAIAMVGQATTPGRPMRHRLHRSRGLLAGLADEPRQALDERLQALVIDEGLRACLDEDEITAGICAVERRAALAADALCIRKWNSQRF